MFLFYFLVVYVSAVVRLICNIGLSDPFIYQSLYTHRMRYKVNFSARFNRFEFRFPFLRSVAIPRLKSPVCSAILLIARRRIIEVIPFLRVLAQCEMQTDLSWIWTRVTVPISDSGDQLHDGPFSCVCWCVWVAFVRECAYILNCCLYILLFIYILDWLHIQYFLII